MKSGLERILGTMAAIPLALAINGGVASADIQTKNIVYHTGKGNRLERQEPSEKKPTASYNNERIEIGDIGEPVIEYSLPMTYLPSLNRTKGRSSPIKFGVFHSTEAPTQSALNTFTNRKTEKSSHYLIDPKGDITELVKPEDTAWHVGEIANPYTIGIELVGEAKRGNFSDEQYDKSALLLIYLARETGVKDVVSHNFISNTIGGTNHIDPGPGFNWKKLKERIEHHKGYLVKPVYTNKQNQVVQK